MGGAVSSGRDNQELVDNLMSGSYIRTNTVERVFRTLDRADYMTPEARDQAYKDLAWRHGPLHLSAPCIYSEVMEALELRPGLSFLNIGSGTGYLTTLVGLIIGSSGINHGVEIHPYVVEYAVRKIIQFTDNSASLDEFDFCEPKYYCGNGLCLAPLQSPYDRVYCGAGCPEEYQNYFKQMIKVGGVLVMPLNDNLVQVRRVADNEWLSRSLLTVSFATLRVPTKAEAADLVRLEEQRPPRLQQLARGVIRHSMRGGLLRRHPELRERPRAPPPRRACPRRICIPIDDDSDVEGLNALHDLDHNTGANEMNALLSLVLSMGQNRVAGALRFDPLDSHSESDSDSASSPPPSDAADAVDADAEAADSAEPFPFNASAEVDMSEPPTLPARPSAPSAPSGAGAPGGAGGPSTSHPSNRRPPGEERKDVSNSNNKKSDDDDDDDSPGSHGACLLISDRDREPHAAGGESGGSSRHSCLGVLTLRFQERLASVGVCHEPGPSQPPQDPRHPALPAEVEIYLGKSGTPSRSIRMDWEAETIVLGETETEAGQKTESDRAASKREGEESSGDQSKCEESSDSELGCKLHKRQKLDSGIGEGSSPSPSPSASTSPSASSTSSPRDAAPRAPLLSSTEEAGGASGTSGTNEAGEVGEVGEAGESGESGEAGEASEAGEAGEAGKRGRWQARALGPTARRRPATQSNDARRVRFSIVMKRAVRELPLPYALKKYVNLGRCFQF